MIDFGTRPCNPIEFSTTTITTGNEWGAGIGLAYSLRF